MRAAGGAVLGGLGALGLTRGRRIAEAVDAPGGTGNAALDRALRRAYQEGVADGVRMGRNMAPQPEPAERPLATYRTAPHAAAERVFAPWPHPRRGVWHRLYCWLRGHDWDLLRINRRAHLARVHLHHLAGIDAQCRRCGYRWDDAEVFPRDRSEPVLPPGLYEEVS